MVFGKRWMVIKRPQRSPKPKSCPEELKLPGVVPVGSNSTDLQLLDEKNKPEETSNVEGPSSWSMLQKSFPDSPKSELRRFADGWPKPNAAIKAYENHLAWRNLSKAEELEEARDELPEWISRGHFVAKDGSAAIFLQMARTDCQKPTELYFKALCCAIEEVVPRHDYVEQFEKITILIDTRGHLGWPNPKPHELLPLLRMCSRQLPLHYPGVMKRIVVYPVPLAAVLFARMALTFVDSLTRNRICLISERTKGGFEKSLEEYVSKDSLPPYARARHPNL